jgi:geranylgeranyl pyrophosphate synthase
MGEHENALVIQIREDVLLIDTGQRQRLNSSWTCLGDSTRFGMTTRTYSPARYAFLSTCESPNQVMTLMQYGEAKGFCEDLDEGKFSFPLMHFINTRCDTHELHELLRQRMETGAMSSESKALVLEMLDESGSLEYTRQVSRMLYEQIKGCISKVENAAGEYNRPMRSFLHALYI